jgi:hypothetical protein
MHCGKENETPRPARRGVFSLYQAIALTKFILMIIRKKSIGSKVIILVLDGHRRP